MPAPDEIRRDLPPDLDPAEAEALGEIVTRLDAGRPAPAPAFRDSLRHRLAGEPADRREAGRRRATGRRSPMTPRAVRALAATYAAAGALLLAMAAAGLAGTGPLAPG